MYFTWFSGDGRVNLISVLPSWAEVEIFDLSFCHGFIILTYPFFKNFFWLLISNLVIF